MKIINIATLAISMVLLCGCVFSFDTPSTQTDVSNAASKKWISDNWLKKNQDDIQIKIVSHIRNRYPVIPKNLAGISVRSVTVRNNVAVHNRSEAEKIENDLKALLDGATNKILGFRTVTIPVDVGVEFLRSKSSGADTAAYFAMLPLCFGSVFIVCPGGGTNYAVIDAAISDSNGKTIQIKGVGASSYISTSILAGDSENYDSEANSKALVAAVADLSTKIVPYLQIQ
jgi:hypothetical protein